MCVSNNAFEMQTYKLSDEIRMNSVYTPVEVVYAEGKRVNVDDKQMLPAGFIKKVVLRDKEGNDYEVEPTENGLSFARGEMSYRDYQLQQKKENRKAITLSTGAVGFIFLMGWAFLKFIG